MPSREGDRAWRVGLGTTASLTRAGLHGEAYTPHAEKEGGCNPEPSTLRPHPSHPATNRAY